MRNRKRRAPASDQARGKVQLTASNRAPVATSSSPDPDFEQFETYADRLGGGLGSEIPPQSRVRVMLDDQTGPMPTSPAEDIFGYDFGGYWRSAQSDGIDLPRMVLADEWGAFKPIEGRMERVAPGTNYSKVTFHHTATDSPEEVERLHGRNPLGAAVRFVLRRPTYGDMGDVGYNFMIGPDGTIYEGRSLAYTPAHARGENPGNIGIAFVGDYTSEELTEAQVTSARSLMEQLNYVYGIDQAVSHADLSVEKPDELRGPTEAGQMEQVYDGLRPPTRFGF